MADFDASAYLSVKVYDGFDDMQSGDTFGPDNRFVLKDVENHSSGFYGAIVEDTQTGEGIFVARGTEGLSDAGDLAADLDLVFGGHGDSQFNAAKSFLETYNASAGSVSVTSAVGHSLGGALSQGIGIAYNLNVVTLGSPGAQAILNNLAVAGFGSQVNTYDYGKITNFVAQNDPIANFGQHLAGSNVQVIDLDGVVDRTINGQIVSAVVEQSNSLGIADEFVLTVINPGGAVLYVISKELLKINFYHDKENYLKFIEENFSALQEEAQIYFIDSETYTISYTDNYGYLQEVEISPSEQGILQFDLEVNDIIANGTVVSQTTTRVTLPDGNEADVTVTVKDENGNQVKITQTRVVDANGNIIIGAPATDTYQTLDSNGDVVSTKEVTTYIDYALRQHQVTEYQKGPDGNWVIRDDITINGQTIEGPTYVVPSDGLLDAFNTIGSSIGSSIGNYLADDNVYKGIVYSAFFSTVTEHFSTFAAYLATGSDVQAGLNAAMGQNVPGTVMDNPEFFETFTNKLQAGVASAISNLIVDEVGEALGLDGVAGDVFEVTASTFTSGFINEGIDIAFKGFDLSAYDGIYTGLVSGKFSWDAEISVDLPGVKTYGDYVQFQLGSALGSYTGGYLAGEVLAPESKGAAIFGSLGSAIGTWATTVSSTVLNVTTALSALGNFGAPFVGAAIGAFIGQIAGTFLGNLFGGDQDEPSAFARVLYDPIDREYQLNAYWEADGGSSDIANSMAQQMVTSVNQIIDLTGGKLREGSQAANLQIGYEGSTYLVGTGNSQVKEFQTAADAVHYAAFRLLKDFDLVGAHAIIQRAWHNSDATNIFEFKQDLETAEAFQNYLLNPAGVLALLMNEPETESAQAWAKILQRAAELELHLPHEKDFDGGWGEALLAQGYDPSLIPEIDGGNIILTDPVTGEQKVLEHVIGPGYEIIRMEGTDGDDLIEIIVDGPSVTYVNAGEGDDQVIGSEEADIIYGGPGDDTIDSLGGNDWVHGGSGMDTIDGGTGDDLIIGSDDDDTLRGGEDRDIIYGYDGNDWLYGGDTGNDILNGGNGDDVLLGNGYSIHTNPNLVFYSTLNGGSGNDELHAGNHDTLIGGAGNDSFYAEGWSQGNIFYITAGAGHDTIHTTHLSDNILRFDNSISHDELFFQQSGQDLKILVLGEDQSITVKNFYAPSNQPLFKIQAWDGKLELADRAAILQAVANDSEIGSQPVGQYNVLSDSAIALGTSDNAEGDEIWTISPAASGYVQWGTDNSDIIYTHNNWITTGGAGHDIIESNVSNTGSQIFYGDSGNDTIRGYSFGDIIIGGLGNDLLYGGADYDQIWGGHGEDHIYGGSDGDLVYGGASNDTIYGGTGDDKLNGQDGDDIIFGEEGNDVLSGQSGNDQITGSIGDDSINGGIGDDTLNGSEGKDTIFGDDGNDVIDGGVGEDWVSAGAGDDILIFTYANNDASEEIYSGGKGTDTLRIYLTAAEFLLPRVEADLIRYKNQIEQQQSGTALVGAIATLAILGLIASEIEVLELYVDGQLYDLSFNPVDGSVGDGTSANDIITGTGNADNLNGGVGHDEIKGFLGNDQLNGGAGDDFIFGNEGDDILDGGGDNDDLQGGEGNDTIEGGEGDDKITGDEGDDIITGSAGEDYVAGGLGNDTLSGGENNDILYGQAGSDTIEGNEGDDYIDGGSGNDILKGNEGNDEILGRAGEDQLEGGIGNDILHGGEDNDILVGGAGDDKLTGSYGDDTLNGNEGTDQAVFSGSHDNYTISDDGTHYTVSDMVGNDGTDTVYKDIEQIIFTDGIYENGTFISNEILLNNSPIAQDDSFSGKINQNITGNLIEDNGNGVDSDPDDDTLSVVAETKTTTQGGSVSISANGSFTYTPGNNYVGIDSFNYTLSDGLETNMGLVNITITDINHITGTAGNETLNGTADIDEIKGMGGDDTLYGNGGNDLLYIGEDADQLYGGSGSDQFIIDANSFIGAKDFINDFSLNDNDIIKIDNLLEGYDPVTSSVHDYLSLSLNNNGHTRIMVDIDGAGINYDPVKIVVLEGFNVTDTQSLMDSGNLVIENGAVPIAQNDNLNGNEDEDVTGNLLIDNGNGIDSDPDGNALSVRAETITTTFGGTVVILASGDFTYTPATNFNGNDSFDYTLLNSLGNTATGTVTISLAAVNDAPAAQDDSFTGQANENVTGNLLQDNGSGPDSDLDGDALNVVAETKATVQGGSVTISADGSFTYTPNTDFAGSDSFEYTLSDGVLTDAGHVSILVTDINQITGTASGETLNGSSNADEIKGLGGDDILYGNDGDDLLYVGEDLDQLFGGNGADTFIIDDNSFVGSKDFIKDFSLNENDIIKIESVLEGYDPLTSAIGDFISLSLNNNGETRIMVDIDGSGTSHAMTKIAVLEGFNVTDTQSLLDSGNLVIENDIV